MELCYGSNRKLIRHTREQLVLSFWMWKAKFIIYLSINLSINHLSINHLSTYHLSLIFFFFVSFGIQVHMLELIPFSVHGISSSIHGMTLFLFKKKYLILMFFPFTHHSQSSCPPPIGIRSNIFNTVLPIHLTDVYLDIWAHLQKYTKLFYVGV